MTEVKVGKLLNVHKRLKHELKRDICRLEQYRNNANYSVLQAVEHRRMGDAFPTNNVSCEDLTEMTAQILSQHRRRNSDTIATNRHSLNAFQTHIKNSEWKNRNRPPQLKPLNKQQVPIKSSLAINGRQLPTLPKIHRNSYIDESAEHRARLIMNDSQLTGRYPRAHPPTANAQELYDKYELEDRTWAENYEYELVKLQTVAKVQDWLFENPVPVQAFHIR